MPLHLRRICIRVFAADGDESAIIASISQALKSENRSDIALTLHGTRTRPPRRTRKRRSMMLIGGKGAAVALGLCGVVVSVSDADAAAEKHPVSRHQVAVTLEITAETSLVLCAENIFVGYDTCAIYPNISLSTNSSLNLFFRELPRPIGTYSIQLPRCQPLVRSILGISRDKKSLLSSRGNSRIVIAPTAATFIAGEFP